MPNLEQRPERVAPQFDMFGNSIAEQPQAPPRRFFCAYSPVAAWLPA
jgi:hypothetical protein